MWYRKLIIVVLVVIVLAAMYMMLKNAESRELLERTNYVEREEVR